MRVSNINNQYNNKLYGQKNSPASFKGVVPQPVVNGLSNFYETVASKKPFQNFIKNFSKSDRTFTHLLVAESCFLSGFYMINTLLNKKIKKDQKPQMIINDTLTLGVSTAGAYLIEDKITDAVMKGAEKYFTKNKDFYMDLGKKAQEAFSPKSQLLEKVGEVAGKTGDDLAKGIQDVTSTLGSHLKSIVSPENTNKAFQITGEKFESLKSSVTDAIKNSGTADKAKETVKDLVDDVYNNSAARAEADKVLSGINKLKVLVILGLIYRFMGPVIITPIANKLSSKFFNKKNEKAEQKK